MSGELKSRGALMIENQYVGQVTFMKSELLERPLMPNERLTDHIPGRFYGRKHTLFGNFVNTWVPNNDLVRACTIVKNIDGDCVNFPAKIIHSNHERIIMVTGINDPVTIVETRQAQGDPIE